MENGALVLAWEHFLEKRALAYSRARFSHLTTANLPMWQKVIIRLILTRGASGSDNISHVFTYGVAKKGSAC